MLGEERMGPPYRGRERGKMSEKGWKGRNGRVRARKRERMKERSGEKSSENQVCTLCTH